MSNTPRLNMPYIVSGQAQKEVTHNDALNLLDGLAQISVINSTTNAPPGSPAEGDSYIIGPSPTGAWVGHAAKIACYYSGWIITAPEEGWLAWDQAADTVYVYNGSAWVPHIGAFTANGSVATVLTSVGPTGASTTVQEWLAVKNSAGVVRYIPCF